MRGPRRVALGTTPAGPVRARGTAGLSTSGRGLRARLLREDEPRALLLAPPLAPPPAWPWGPGRLFTLRKGPLVAPAGRGREARATVPDEVRVGQPRARLRQGRLAGPPDVGRVLAVRRMEAAADVGGPRAR